MDGVYMQHNRNSNWDPVLQETHSDWLTAISSNPSSPKTAEREWTSYFKTGLTNNQAKNHALNPPPVPGSLTHKRSKYSFDL